MKLSKQVFRIDNIIKEISVDTDYCHFNEESLVKALKEIIREYSDNENTSMTDSYDQAPDFYPVFIIVTEDQDTDDPVKLFRSYECYKDPCLI